MKALIVVLALATLVSCNQRFYSAIEKGTLTVSDKDLILSEDRFWGDKGRVWIESDLPYVGGLVNSPALWGIVKAREKIPFTAQKLYLWYPFSDQEGSYTIVNIKGVSILLRRDIRDDYEYLKSGHAQ